MNTRQSWKGTGFPSFTFCTEDMSKIIRQVIEDCYVRLALTSFPAADLLAGPLTAGKF